ncbi:UDP-galactose transporter senju isoform X2 [Belonocnema kinseyi]|uniref:UDP-galactose transporter senju isoform X2 n=1 Tax=Belonocnema kinseyi TaxID=2817044 RepID=UPI00143D1734|nr:UDP-galactose transporter senju isoform X2 [Belonocnema kinseyi]
MGFINWTELFPGEWSSTIFILYVALFINQGVLVTLSQHEGKYQYNTVLVVLMTEVLKLIISTLLYLQENPMSSILHDIHKYRKVLTLYMVPSSLYCLYNNLAFLNLATFDPTTYFLLLQFRVVITGIVFQVIFKKQLATKQWISLIILTAGCMIKHLSFDFYSSFSDTNFKIDVNILFIFVQTICSCLAGVYNEYLLKSEGANIHLGHRVRLSKDAYLLAIHDVKLPTKKKFVRQIAVALFDYDVLASSTVIGRSSNRSRDAKKDQDILEPKKFAALQEQLKNRPTLSNKIPLK